MKKTLTSILSKFGTLMIALAVIAAPLASEICRTRYYQPEEPEGLEAFAKKHE